MIHDDHEDIIKRGIDNRMDLYRLIFLLVQIVALFFLALKVYWRNNELQVRFLARVKKRLIVLNEEKNLKLDIKLTLFLVLTSELNCTAVAIVEVLRTLIPVTVIL